MAAGGASAAAGRVSEDAWRDFVERIAETLDVGPGTSVFDVGCGAGAFLLPLDENGYLVGGIDPSPSLVEKAKAAMPSGQWKVGSAETLDPGEPWDVVVSVSRFAGFKDLDEARGVLARMTAKATHAIAVLDVADAAIDRAWILHTLAEIGASAVQIEDQRLEGDALASTRFNVFARL